MHVCLTADYTRKRSANKSVSFAKCMNNDEVTSYHFVLDYNGNPFITTRAIESFVLRGGGSWSAVHLFENVTGNDFRIDDHKRAADSYILLLFWCNLLTYFVILITVRK